MRALFLFAGLLLLTSLQAQTKKLSGTWKATTRTQTYWLIFANDTTATLVRGKDSTTGRFTLDTTQAPMHVDIETRAADNSAGLHMRGIAEFMGPIRLRVRFSLTDPEARPKTFMPKGNPETLVFIKQ